MMKPQKTELASTNFHVLHFAFILYFKRGFSPTTKPANLYPNLMAKVHPRPVLHNT